MLNNVVKSVVQFWNLLESHIDQDNSATTLRELHPLPRPVVTAKMPETLITKVAGHTNHC